LEGFFFNTIGRLLGLKPSSSDPELCNKCEGADSTESEPARQQLEESIAPESATSPSFSDGPEAPADQSAPEPPVQETSESSSTEESSEGLSGEEPLP